MIQSLEAGAQFRWKEDPNNTIYTVIQPPDVKNLLRYDTNPLDHDGKNRYSSYVPPVHFKSWNNFKH